MKLRPILFPLIICAVSVVPAEVRAQVEEGQKATEPPQATEVKPPQEQPGAPLISGKAGGRPKVPEDLLAIRSYAGTSISPDGKLVAVVIQGRVPGATRDIGNALPPNHRNDLWVVHRTNGARERLTLAKPDTWSQWHPVWSPKSNLLAFLSTEGKDNAFLELWDRATGQVRQLSALGVDLDARISRNSYQEDSLFWVDETHLAVVLLPSGSRSRRFDDNSHSAVTAVEGARASAEGAKSTGIVATSPPDPSRFRSLPLGRLVIIDTSTNAVREIGELPEFGPLLAQRFIVISPNGKWAAIEASIPPDSYIPGTPSNPFTLMSRRLGVASLEGVSSSISWLDDIQPVHHAGTSLVRWRDGEPKFAVLCQEPTAAEATYLAEVEAPTRTRRLIGRIDAQLKNGLTVAITRVAWLPDGRAAVKAIAFDPPPGVEADLRRDWWTVESDKVSPVLSKADLALLDADASAKDHADLETSETGRLYERNETGGEHTLFSDLNPQLAEIEEPRSISFAYKTLDGRQEYASLLLPHGYTPGLRYPTVVWVYGGDIHLEKDKPAERNDDNAIGNLMLLSGHGYAVLVPSVPLPPEREPGDRMLHLNDGVDPAIDQAIALGVVDPNRLALMGHSYGGYSVFGLLTQTHRYRAGIASMGVSDLISQFGEFETFYRYDEPSYSSEINPAFVEWSQMGMGVPPWADPERYVRNSPIFSANQITTPLLIFAGDADFIGPQGEEMFTALSRQGKRAEYVCYLGETHIPSSPPNILDMWQRIFAWLDTYVKNPEDAKQ